MKVTEMNDFVILSRLYDRVSLSATDIRIAAKKNGVAITTSTLHDRLKTLVSSKYIDRRKEENTHPVYSITEKGKEKFQEYKHIIFRFIPQSAIFKSAKNSPETREAFNSFLSGKTITTATTEKPKRISDTLLMEISNLPSLK